MGEQLPLGLELKASARFSNFVAGPNAELIVIDGYDHVCCWTELWPTILADIAAAER